MPERRPYIAANWKMNKTIAEAGKFLDAIVDRVESDASGAEVVACPPYLALRDAVERCSGTSVRIAAQNMHQAESGAFTGEVSAGMLEEIGVDAVVLGHSERRALFAETDEALAQKVPVALAAGLEPILCVGETEGERDASRTEDVLATQVRTDLEGVAPADLDRVVVAYEPVWAIGTGRTATPEQAQEACDFIRRLLAALDAGAAERVRILYGGSVKPGNAEELLALPDVDGALVGGASLEVDDFAAIVAAVPR